MAVAGPKKPPYVGPIDAVGGNPHPVILQGHKFVLREHDPWSRRPSPATPQRAVGGDHHPALGTDHVEPVAVSDAAELPEDGRAHPVGAVGGDGQAVSAHGNEAGMAVSDVAQPPRCGVRSNGPVGAVPGDHQHVGSGAADQQRDPIGVSGLEQRFALGPRIARVPVVQRMGGADRESHRQAQSRQQGDSALVSGLHPGSALPILLDAGLRHGVAAIGAESDGGG